MAGGEHEVIVVDGGSTDETVQIAEAAGARVISCGRGRGEQMAAGAELARGDVLWFLHADTLAPPMATDLIEAEMRNERIIGGNFGVGFSGDSLAARFLTWLHPKTHGPKLSFGDSAIFVRRNVYLEVGGFRPYPLFEDLDLVKRLLKKGRFVRLPARVTTSSRRFEGRSFLRTYLLWVSLLFLYKIGVHPQRIARCYRVVR